MPEIACTSATARRRDRIWATSRLMTRAWMPYCTGCCRGTGPCTSGIPRRGARRPRTRCRAALPIDGAVDVTAPQASQATTVSSTMILRRLSPICRFGFGPLLPARSRPCPSVTAADRSSGSCVVFSRRTTMRMSSRMTKTRITASSATLPAARSAAIRVLAASNSSRAARRHHPALRFISAPLPRCVSTYRSCGGWSPGSSWHSPLVAFDPK